MKYKKYTIHKATLYLKTILLKNVFLKRSLAGIAGDLFLKLYLVVLVSGKFVLRGWLGILVTFLQIQFLLCLTDEFVKYGSHERKGARCRHFPSYITQFLSQ